MPDRTSQITADSIEDHSPLLLIVCGLLGFFGAASLIVTNAIGSMVVPDHDWMADTVSDLAAGEYEWIQDFGLHAYAAGLLACAIASAHYHLGTGKWSLGILCLAVLALCVEIIGARNEYGDGDDEGIVIHIYLVYGLGVFFTAAPLLMASGLGRIRPIYKWISIGCGLLWAGAAPVFFLLPTGIDGAWERGLGIITIVWVCILSWIFLSVGRRMMRNT